MAQQHQLPTPGQRRWLPIWNYPLTAVAVWFIVIGLVLYFLPSVKLVALGFLAASAVAAALRPLARLLPGRRALRGTLVGLGFLIVVAVLVFLVSWLLADTIQREMAQWPQYRTKLNEALAQWSRRLGLDQPITVSNLLSQVGSFLVGPGGTDLLNQTANVATDVLIALAFVFIGSIYLLAESPGLLLDPLSQMLPPRRRVQFNAALQDLEPQLRWWLIGTLISMTIIGVTSWIGFTIVGLSFAVPLALLAGFAEIVPTVGPIMAFLVAFLFAIPQGTGVIVGVVIVYIITQLLESYIVTPLVMKRVVDLPPVVTLFTVVLWGKLLGPAGLLLAIPLDLLVWSFARHFLLQPRSPQEPSSNPPSA